MALGAGGWCAGVRCGAGLAPAADDGDGDGNDGVVANGDAGGIRDSSAGTGGDDAGDGAGITSASRLSMVFFAASLALPLRSGTIS